MIPSLDGRGAASGPIIYYSTVHAWHSRQHFYQGLAKAFAQTRPVLYVSASAWLERASRPGQARRISGGFLWQPVPNLTVLQALVPRGARFKSIARARDWLVARATFSAMAEARMDPDTSVVWCYAADAVTLIKQLPQSISVYWTGDEVIDPREQKLLETVDFVFAISPGALSVKRAIVGERAFQMPMAIDPDPFVAACTAGRTPHDLVQLERPLIGYGGGLNWRIDWRLLRAVASRARGTLVLVGPLLDDEAEDAVGELTASLPNVRWMGHRSEDEAPAYVAAFDVALIPYKRNRFNDGSNPVKFYEYLAAGVPVVSSSLPALQRFQDLAWFADEPAAFADSVEAALDLPPSLEAVGQRQTVARAHNFTALVTRIDQILGTMRKPMTAGRRVGRRV